MWTMGASLGAYHAANTLFHYPHLVKRCFALSGIYDLRDFMDGIYDDNFYFHNPVDYMANLTDPWLLGPAGDLRHPPGHRVRPVGEERRVVRAVGRARADGHSPLTSTTGARAAATTGRTGRIRCGSIYLPDGEASLHGSRDVGPRQSNFSSRYCPSAITCSSSIQTSQSRVSTSTWVRDFQSALVWLP